MISLCALSVGLGWIGAAVSQPVTVSNGTPQGCPLSILFVNALMSIWADLLRQRVPELRAGAFIDDRSLRTADPESLEGALTITDQFDNDSGSSPNRDKTKLLVTHLPLEQAVHGLTHGPSRVTLSPRAKLLGVSLSARATALTVTWLVSAPSMQSTLRAAFNLRRFILMLGSIV